MTERLHFPFSLSCIGEGNGNPLQCSCLENPRDSGAWWAAIDGVAQKQTRLKRLSSSSMPCFRDLAEENDNGNLLSSAHKTSLNGQNCDNRTINTKDYSTVEKVLSDLYKEWLASLVCC